MKVVCIDDKWEPLLSIKAPHIAFGEIMTVAKTYSSHGTEWYQFLEMGPDWQYEQCGFAPLSSINETEMERNYKTEKV